LENKEPFSEKRVAFLMLEAGNWKLEEIFVLHTSDFQPIKFE